MDIGEVFGVVRPLGWVGFDVTVDAVHFAFVTDDAFVIVTLPNGDAGGIT